MKDLFEQLNDETIHFEEFEEAPLTALERKSIKKRLKKKLPKRRSMPVKTLAAVASLTLVSILAVNANFALANIPIVGEKLEAFVYSQAGALTDYKTIIGDSVEDNGVKVTLNEVILDEGQLLISSTFHTKLEDADLAYNWYTDIDVYIDGKKIEQGGGGGPREITDSYIHYFWTADIGQMDVQKEKSLRIVFNDLERSDSEKMMKGKWSFKFKASGENLIANSTKIPIHQRFSLENGQKIEVEELVLTPVSSKLVYTMSNIVEDVYFEIENEQGELVQGTISQQAHFENYNRFEALEGGKIKIIPVVSKFDHSQEYTLTNEIIELDLDAKEVIHE